MEFFDDASTEILMKLSFRDEWERLRIYSGDELQDTIFAYDTWHNDTYLVEGLYHNFERLALPDNVENVPDGLKITRG